MVGLAEDMTVGEVAKELRLSERWVREKLNSKQLLGYKLGRRWFVPREAVAAFRESNTNQPLPIPTNNLLLFSIEARLRQHWDAIVDETRKLRDLISRQDVWRLRDRHYHILDYPPIKGNRSTWIGDADLLSLEGEGSLRFKSFIDHLEQDLPLVYQKLQQWKIENLALTSKIADHRKKWAGLVAQELRNQQLKPPSDALGFLYWVVDTLAQGYLLLVHGIEVLRDDSFGFLKEDENGLGYYLYRKLIVKSRGPENDWIIAGGSESWIRRLKDFVEQFYLDHIVEFIVELKDQGDPCLELKNLADDAYEELEYIVLGGSVFRPGNCEVCRRLMSHSQSSQILNTSIMTLQSTS